MAALERFVATAVSSAGEFLKPAAVNGARELPWDGSS
jgi:hypothetical protein